MSAEKTYNFIWRFRHIVWLAAAVLIISGFYKANTYNSFYESEVDIIMKQPAANFALLSSFDKIAETDIKAKFTLFSGNFELGTVNVEANTVAVKTSTKAGKIKMLMLNEQNEAAVFEEISDKEININIANGKYRIVLIGKWFSGDIIFRTNAAKAF